MTKLLEFNPDKRIVVEDCLAHPYVEQFHTDNEDDEIICEKPIGTFFAASSVRRANLLQLFLSTTTRS